MSDDVDIVDRLRIAWTSMTAKANAEREEAADEIERLRDERDEARRRICEDAVHLGDVYRRVNGLNVRLATGREVADMMGWDCYREETTDER